MNKNLICPKCSGQLVIEHYNQKHSTGAELVLSRLSCSKCDYRKDPIIPEILFTEANSKLFEKDERGW